MLRLVCWILGTCIRTFLIITAADLVVIGGFSLRFSRKCSASQFVVQRENRIDLQEGNACSGYAAAYLEKN